MMGWFDSLMALPHDAAFYTLWISAGTIFAILVTAFVALYGIFSGNQDKRRERAIQLLRQAQSDEFNDLGQALTPTPTYWEDRQFLDDSYEGTRTLDYTTLVNLHTGKPITEPLTKQEVYKALVTFTNLLEEMYIHLQYNLVDRDVILNALSAMILPVFYAIEPLMTKVESRERTDFTPARRFALLAQQRLRKIRAHFSPALLNYAFSASSEVRIDEKGRKPLIGTHSTTPDR